MNALIAITEGSDTPSFLEFILPAIPGLVVLVALWILIRGFFRKVGRHMEQTAKHQRRMEDALDVLLRERKE